MREAVYEFPAAPPVADGLKALSFEQGQIADLAVEVHFAAGADREKARAALALLSADRRKGDRTSVLSYPACARPDLRSALRRLGAVAGRPAADGRDQAAADPGFKERPAADPAGKEFDLARPLFDEGRLFGPGPRRHPRRPRRRRRRPRRSRGRGPGRARHAPGHGHGRSVVPRRPAGFRDRKPEGPGGAHPGRLQHPDRRPPQDRQAQAPGPRAGHRADQGRAQGLRQIRRRGRSGRRRGRAPRARSPISPGPSPTSATTARGIPRSPTWPRTSTGSSPEKRAPPKRPS
ncbi:MAG: hypothetical protein M0C28_01940 [Candidatus Moduliflexus flocculans]|nr:hypothetical protein [Candidatus Moduliflexus flocculans]